MKRQVLRGVKTINQGDDSLHWEREFTLPLGESTYPQKGSFVSFQFV